MDTSYRQILDHKGLKIDSLNLFEIILKFFTLVIILL